MTFSRSSSDSEPQPQRARHDAAKGAEPRATRASGDADERAEEDVTGEGAELGVGEGAASKREADGDHGTLQPQPRRLDRRLDGESSDPDGAHVCAPTDA